jgi:hypothetical protein
MAAGLEVMRIIDGGGWRAPELGSGRSRDVLWWPALAELLEGKTRPWPAQLRREKIIPITPCVKSTSSPVQTTTVHPLSIQSSL